jgi:hypothetical protein
MQEKRSAPSTTAVGGNASALLRRDKAAIAELRRNGSKPPMAGLDTRCFITGLSGRKIDHG